MAQQEKGFPTPTISGMTGFIFVNEEGRLHSPEAINRAIDTITRWCNKEEEQKAQEESREPIIIPHFSCHVFRHTFCTRFCKNETNIKVIQEIMGHANISIAMDIYAKATEEKKKQALDELSRSRCLQLLRFRVFHPERVNGNTFHHLIFQRAVFIVGCCFSNFIYLFQPLNHLSKCRVSAV